MVDETSISKGEKVEKLKEIIASKLNHLHLIIKYKVYFSGDELLQKYSLNDDYLERFLYATSFNIEEALAKVSFVIGKITFVNV